MFSLQAMEVYIKAIKKIPNFKEAQVNLGQAYKDLGQLHDALRHFDMVTQIFSIYHTFYFLYLEM